jgi:hypothetical protein
MLPSRKYIPVHFIRVHWFAANLSENRSGAERQEEAGHQWRQLCARLHRRVRELQVPLQLHRVPGPRQAEGSEQIYTISSPNDLMVMAYHGYPCRCRKCRSSATTSRSSARARRSTSAVQMSSGSGEAVDFCWPGTLLPRRQNFRKRLVYNLLSYSYHRREWICSIHYS